MSKPKTHTGVIVTKDGEKTVKIRETATTWCVGPRETYDKFTGCRVGAPLTKRRLKLESIKPIEGGAACTIVSIPDDWQTCEKLSDDSYVDNALRELVEDTTGDNGVRVVQSVIRALRDSGLIRTYPDLSQPVDPQISEYEQIMLQAGWVMVPIEPTDEMIAAAMECDDVVFDSKDPTAFCVQYREIYCAMVGVAPKPEGNNR